MSTTMTEWGGLPGPAGGLSMLPVAIDEFRRHKLMLIGAFAVIALATLGAGVLMPKQYTSSTTILVEEGNIIGPLMEGRAVPTGVTNRAGIAKEVAFSRKVMEEILQVGGWLKSNPSAVEKDRRIEQITNRTKISNPRENLIEIEYTDSDPQRAYEVTKSFGDLVIEESLAAKERESREAFEFIDTQVTQYHSKLTDAEAKLEAYRQANPDSRPGMAVDVNTRIGELRRQVEGSRMDVLDLKSQESALQSQISGESEISAVQTRAGQIRARMVELQSERERLLLSYTEQYPDVVRVQHQLSDLQDELKREDSRRESRLAQSPGALDDSVTMNPLYTELRSKLADARRQSAATSSRVANGSALLNEEIARSGRIASSESALSELTRDYEVNRDLYQDLLKRRENARVSMNLDAEHRGLSFRIQEPAAVPLRHSGLRLLYVCLAGLALAVALPILFLFGKLKVDPRIRSPGEIERKAGLPLLGVVPLLPNPERQRQSTRTNAMATLMVLAVVAAYAVTMAMKLANAS
ncbi:MAG: XrtA system polysaccharide chain length determinant [Thermomonas sp.]